MVKQPGSALLSGSEGGLERGPRPFRKDGIVKQLTGGVAQLLKHNGVKVINGQGTVKDKHTIEVGETAVTRTT